MYTLFSEFIKKAAEDSTEVETSIVAEGKMAEIAAVMEDAQDAFWAVVAKNFPEIKSGDVEPAAAAAFDKACGAAIQSWLATNMNESLEHLKPLLEAHGGEMHFSPHGLGALGDMLVMDDHNPMIPRLAKALGVKDGWKLTKTGDIFAAYNSGDRLSLFTNKNDYTPDDLD